MRKWLGVICILFNALFVVGQDSLYKSDIKRLALTFSKQTQFSEKINASVITTKGSISLFFDIELATKHDTITLNASIKKLSIESTIANKIRMLNSENPEDLSGESGLIIKSILASPVILKVSANNGQLIWFDTSKADRLLTFMPWENFIYDFASSIFTVANISNNQKQLVFSKKSDQISEQIHFLFDSTSAQIKYYSFSGSRTTNAEKMVAGISVIQQIDFNLEGSMQEDSLTRLLLNKKTIYSGKGNLIFGSRKNPIEVKQVIESKIQPL